MINQLWFIMHFDKAIIL